MVDISLTDITPCRQVNTAEDQRVSRVLMVADHVAIDIATAVHLRLESDCHRLLGTSSSLLPGPTSTQKPFLCSIPDSKSDTPSSPGVFHRSYKVGTHLVLLQEWGILPSNGDTRRVGSQHKIHPRVGRKKWGRERVPPPH